MRFTKNTLETQNRYYITHGMHSRKYLTRYKIWTTRTYLVNVNNIKIWEMCHNQKRLITLRVKDHPVTPPFRSCQRQVYYITSFVKPYSWEHTFVEWVEVITKLVVEHWKTLYPLTTPNFSSFEITIDTDPFDDGHDIPIPGFFRGSHT